MKITFISPPTPNPSPSYYGPPYGLSVLSAILKQKGHTVSAYDWDRFTLEDALLDAPRVLSEDNPDVIGISVLSVTVGAAIVLAKKYKELAPNIPLIVGGPYLSSDWKNMFERAPIDIACIGDAEETLPELLEAIEQKTDLQSVSGIAYRKDDSMQRTKVRPEFKDLDSLPFPDFDVFSMSKNLQAYASPERDALLKDCREFRPPYEPNAMVMILGTRGCIYKCSFCPMSKQNGKVRAHSAKYIVDMMEHAIKKYGVRDMVMGDNLFTWTRDRVIRLCDELIARDLGVSWICMTRADMVDPELLSKMAQAGCREISYGIESLSWDVQKAMRKNLKVEKIPNVFQQTHEAGINSTLMMMVGNEGESEKSLRETSWKARAINPDRILIYPTTIYPGTKLYDTALQKGMFSDEYLAMDDPPLRLYTAELGEDGLERCVSMLQHRSLYFAVAKDEPSESVIRRLGLAAWRSQHFIFGPGAIQRKELPDWFRALSRINSRSANIFIENPAWLQHAAVRQRLHDGPVRDVIVPIFGYGDTHDEIVGEKGAFKNTVRGLFKWKRSRGTIVLWVLLHQRNIDQLCQIVEWAEALEISRLQFVYHQAQVPWAKVAVEDLPGIHESGLEIFRASQLAKSMIIEVTGLPECALHTDPLDLQERWRPFDELWHPHADMAHELRAKQKIKPPECIGCIHYDSCEGLWKGVRCPPKRITAQEPSDQQEKSSELVLEGRYLDPPSTPLAMLFLTRRCNIDCTYCHMDHKNYSDTSEQTLMDAIDLFYRTHDEWVFHLFGGEPLMRTDSIDFVINYIADKWSNKPKPTFLLTTNGLLLNDKNLDFLEERGIKIMLSLDGTAESQAEFRGPSNNPMSVHRRITKNIQRMNERGIQYFVNTVVSPANLDKMEANLLALKALGIRTMQFSYEFGIYWNRENRQKYVETLLDCIQKYHQEPSDHDLGFQIQNTPSSEPLLGNSFFAVDVDGRLYRGCAVVLEHTLPSFNESAKIGHIHDYETLHGIKKPRVLQVKHFLDGTRHSADEYKRLHSNMHLGYQVRSALVGIRHHL